MGESNVGESELERGVEFSRSIGRSGEVGGPDLFGGLDLEGCRKEDRERGGEGGGREVACGGMCGSMSVRDFSSSVMCE